MVFTSSCRPILAPCEAYMEDDEPCCLLFPARDDASWSGLASVWNDDVWPLS